MVALGATFAGVWSALYADNRRRRKQELSDAAHRRRADAEAFATRLQSVEHEAEDNAGTLAVFYEQAALEDIPDVDPQTEALRTALTASLSFRHASPGLLKTMRTVLAMLNEVENTVADCRAVRRQGLPLEKNWLLILKRAARQARRIIEEALLPHVRSLLEDLNVQPRPDPYRAQIDGTIMAIIRERDKLSAAGLARPADEPPPRPSEEG